MISLTPHHIGCAVSNFAESLDIYSGTLGFVRRTRAFDIASQQVRVCFVDLGNKFYLELVEPKSNEAKLASYLKIGFYHLCFLVADLAAAREQLMAQHFFSLPAFESEAFAGALCQFFVTPQSHLIELAQVSMSDFDDFFDKNRAAQN